MNRKRLEILRDTLRQPMGNLRFDLRDWINTSATHWPNGQDGVDHYNDPTPIIQKAYAGKNYCGTAACAVGLACAIPALQAEGLAFAWAIRAPRYGELEGWPAVCKFFEIGMSDALEMFSDLRYPPDLPTDDPSLVAEMIDALLRVEGDK